MSATIELIKRASGLLIKSERTNYWALSADSSLVQLCLQDQCQRQLSEHGKEGVVRPGSTRAWNRCNIRVACYDSRLCQLTAVSSSFTSHKWIIAKGGGSQATWRVSSPRLIRSDRVFGLLGQKQEFDNLLQSLSKTMQTSFGHCEEERGRQTKKSSQLFENSELPLLDNMTWKEINYYHPAALFQLLKMCFIDLQQIWVL